MQDGSGRLEKSDSYANSTLQFASLDSILAKHNFVPNFIKVDTDGFDFKVLRSCENYLKRAKPSLYFEWDKAHLEAQNEDYLSIFPILREFGYKEAIVYDNFGNLLCALDLRDMRNFKLLMQYVAHSNQNIYYYDIFALGEGMGVDEFLRYVECES